MVQLIYGLLSIFAHCPYSQSTNRDQILLPNLNSVDETKGFINSNDVRIENEWYS